MPKRPCLGFGGQPCRRLTDRADSRCEDCARQWHRARDARRGTPAERGYDAKHRATRARLLPKAYGKPCPRCGEIMLDQPLDLGHPIGAPLRLDPTSRADHISCARCNRGARD